MEQINIQTIALTTGGGTVSLTQNYYDQGMEYIVTGGGTCTGSSTITAAVTPKAGTKFKFYYKGTFVLGTYNITIFGKALTQEEAKTLSIIEVLYDGSAYVVTILPDYSSLPNGVSGVRSQAVLTSGTVTLKPTLDKKNQRFTGTVTLVGNYTVALDTATAVEGNEFWLDFDALITIGANVLTVAGNVITAANALVGGFSVYCYYDGSTWYSQIVPAPTTSTSGIYNQGFKVFVDATYGNDSTGTAQRADLPFLTIAAARTAAVALTPTATSRVGIYATGYFEEGYIAANYVDLYNNGNLIMKRTSGASLATIDDNNAAVDFKIYGYPKLLRSGTGTTPVGCLITRNASTVCEAWINPTDCTTTGTSDTTVGCVNGTLTVYATNMDNSGALTNTDATTIGISGGTFTLRANNVTCVSNTIGISGGTAYFYLGNIVGTGTGADSPIVVKGSSTTYIEYVNGTFAGSTRAFLRAEDAAVATIICKGKTTAQGYVVQTIAASTADITWKGNGEAVTTEAVLIDGTCTIRLEGRLKATGANKDCISFTTVTSTLTIKDLEMVTNGTGKCMYAGSAVNVKNYGGCVGTVAKDANVTETVSSTTISTAVV